MDSENTDALGLVGAVLDEKYNILSVIGRGGMGTVYRARHRMMGRELAVKVLHPEAAIKPRNVRRFTNEARITAALGHENIIAVTDMGVLTNGSPFIVMELLKGKSLAQRIADDGPLPIREAVEIMASVLSALAVVHQTGVVHRDLKPDNVFLNARPGGKGFVVKLLDFGISMVRTPDLLSLQLTKTGSILGTPYYMAPEQALGQSIDHQADIYAAGVLLYEAITATRPYDAENYNALMMSIASEEPPPPRTFRPDIPPELEEVILTAMARDVGQRYASATEFLEALKPFAPSVVTTILETTWTPGDEAQKTEIPTPREQVPVRTATLPRPEAPSRGRRPWPLILGGLAVMVSVVSVIVWLGLFRGEVTADEGRAQVISADDRSADAGGAASKTGSGHVQAGRAGPVGDAAVITGPTTMELEVRAEPPSAVFRIDGIEVEGNPFKGRFPRDGASHRVNAVAEGFEPQAEFVAFDGDHLVEFELQPLAEGREERHRRPPRKRPPAPPSKAGGDPFPVDHSNPYGGQS